MDSNPVKARVAAFKLQLKTKINQASAFLQTPFGATAGGGLFVVVIAKLLFG